MMIISHQQTVIFSPIFNLGLHLNLHKSQKSSAISKPVVFNPIFHFFFSSSPSCYIEWGLEMMLVSSKQTWSLHLSQYQSWTSLYFSPLNLHTVFSHYENSKYLGKNILKRLSASLHDIFSIITQVKHAITLS